MTYSIETKNLTHRFSNENTLLENINLQVPQGSIFGFLGENGAGKTTTLKLILGLLKIQKGDISIFGKDLYNNRITTLSEIGSLIESPSFYAHLNARDNLIILQKIYQCPKERIDEVLKIVGLAEVGKKKVSQFSLGMKQRLSIGIALLHQPKLLILDEPTNGLDPNGIIEIRTLLKSINKEFGTTIIISSHLLAEIEKLVSHLAIINEGQLVYQGTYDALKAKQNELATIKIQTNDLPKTYEILLAKGLSPIIKNNMICIPRIEPIELSGIVKLLIVNDLNVYQVASEEMDLESMFINLTKN
ncbi:MAG: ABC transporter ATP-binding protein [Saprospiraceae bacterium]